MLTEKIHSLFKWGNFCLLADDDTIKSTVLHYISTIEC